MAEFVPYVSRETYHLNGIPAAHKRNIQRRATKANTSFANIVAQILAARCGIPFIPSKRKHRPTMWWRTDSLVVRVPREVMDCIRDDAWRGQITMRSVILNNLSDAFGLKRPPATRVEPGREPGRRKEK